MKRLGPRVGENAQAGEDGRRADIVQVVDVARLPDTTTPRRRPLDEPQPPMNVSFRPKESQRHVTRLSTDDLHTVTPSSHQ